MSINIIDPLALVAIQAGQVGTPTSEGAAAGGSKLDTPQRSVEIGEPVPIVFGRRRTVGGIEAGGVLISPGATECRFENDTSNNVTAYYHLVLSEGQIDSIAVRDVFQGACRVGSHTQTYSRRAGTWEPGNFITQIEIAAVQFSFDPWDAVNPTWYNATQIDGIWRYFIDGVEYIMGLGAGKVQQVKNTGGMSFPVPDASSYCGSIGAYPGMSTLSFNMTTPNESEFFKKQVHCFIRGGMHVTRLYDNTEGPSDNFADLVQWMLTNSGRVPTSLIDTTALDAAATFLEVNGFTCNCWITESVNYADLLVKWAPYFLLCESNASGKRGLRPVLPTTEAGAIDTGAITPVWTFTEDHITAGSLEIQYSNLAERRPFVAQVIWRQQLDDDFGIIRTAEVRYSGTADTGPYESHDLSEFCTTENHAVKVGAYILSKRTRTSHTIRFSARPQSHNTLVTAGDIIRVRLARQATTAGTGYHDFLYQVERITKTMAGELSYECTHFPVNADGASLIALDVAAATGTGILLTSSKTGVGCDINSPNDNTIPDETWSDADDLGAGQTLIGSGYESAPDGDQSNTDDEFDDNSLIWTGPGISGIPEIGEILTAPTICEGGVTRWWLYDPDTDNRVGNYVSTGSQLPIDALWDGYGIGAETICPGNEQGYQIPWVGPIVNPSNLTFDEPGNYEVSGTYVDDLTELRRCADGLLLGAASVTPYGFAWTFNNVTSLNVQHGGTAVLEFRCGPGVDNIVSKTILMATSQNADGTTSVQKTEKPSGINYATSYRFYRYYFSRLIVKRNGVTISDRNYEMEV